MLVIGNSINEEKNKSGIGLSFSTLRSIALSQQCAKWEHCYTTDRWVFAPTIVYNEPIMDIEQVRRGANTFIIFVYEGKIGGQNIAPRNGEAK